MGRTAATVTHLVAPHTLQSLCCLVVPAGPEWSDRQGKPQTPRPCPTYTCCESAPQQASPPDTSPYSQTRWATLLWNCRALHRGHIPRRSKGVRASDPTSWTAHEGPRDLATQPQGLNRCHTLSESEPGHIQVHAAHNQAMCLSHLVSVYSSCSWDSAFKEAFADLTSS